MSGGAAIAPIVSGVGAIAGLTGGNNAARAAGGYRGQQMNELQGLGQTGDQFGQIGRDAGMYYGQYMPQANTALENYASYLGRNPNTDQQWAADTSRAQRNSSSAYDAARSGIAASMAARGLGGPSSSGPGSVEGGAQTAIDLSQAGDISNAGNIASQEAAQRYASNQSQLTGLLSGAAQQQLGNEEGAYGQQGQIQGEVAGQYGNLADMYTQLGQQQAQGFAGALGGAASGIASGSTLAQQLKALGLAGTPAAAPGPTYNSPISYGAPPGTGPLGFGGVPITTGWRG